MKRIIYILAIVMTVVTLLGGVTVFADTSAENLTRGTVYSENSDETSLPDGESTVTNEHTDTAGDAQQKTDVADGTEGEKTNPFEVVFLAVKEYATEIFCALSFIGSILLAYAYKKGLLPIIKRGIGAISTTVSTIKETAERGESKTDELSKKLSDRLAGAEKCLGDIENAIDTLGTRLDGLQSDSDERKQIKVILAAQIDMLYSIFMTSALPQYQKDEVGVKIAMMREALLENESE